MTNKLTGVMPAMVTPFNENGDLNLAALPSYLDFQRSAGMDGVVVCGTNGEGISLSVSERKRLLEAVMQQRESLLVVAATGTPNYPETIEITQHAENCGVDAVLVLPPFFFKNPTSAGLADYFRRVLDSVSLPVLLYSIPQQSAITITDEVLSLLSDRENLAGLKDSQGLWDRTSSLITRNPNLRVFAGNDELLSKAMSLGGAGAISGTANAFPELVVGIREAVKAGDTTVAQSRLDAAKTILLQYPLIAAAKSVLANRGVDRMWVRPPLINLTMQQEDEMIGRFRDAGLI